MNAVRTVVQSASMIASPCGTRFRLVSQPSQVEVRGCVVFAHAFAEEMNKSRRMVARMARLLAADGWRVVQVDLYGCGDSGGEFRDATWAKWSADLDAQFESAVPHGPVWLWCMRAGALLAPAVLARRPQVNLLLWQPVLSGAQHLRQFLRLHEGARIVGSGSEGAGPSELLKDGREVEVGGYELGAQLASDIGKASFDLPPGYAGRVVWFEISSLEAAPVPRLTCQAIESLRQRGADVEFYMLYGPPFWQTQEITECESLLERSCASLRSSETPSPRASQL